MNDDIPALTDADFEAAIRQRPGHGRAPALRTAHPRPVPQSNADEFMIYEWEDTQWAEGPMEPVDVASEARDRGVEPRGPHPDDADDRLQRALDLLGSTLSPTLVRQHIQQSAPPSETVQAIMASTKSPPTEGALERLLPALIEVWNVTPRPELDGRSPAETIGAATPATAQQPKVGRNDMCPCGSGQKYKRCYLRNAPN